MRVIAVTAVLVVALSACAAAPNPPDAAAASPTPLAVFGTPLLVALKFPLCAATIAVAAPLGAVSEFAGPTPDDDPAVFRQDLNDGIGRNCGPPYAIAP